VYGLQEKKSLRRPGRRKDDDDDNNNNNKKYITKNRMEGAWNGLIWLRTGTHGSLL